MHAFAASHLPIVGPWFDDLDTARWLGRRAWPEQLLLRASRLPDRYALLGVRDGVPVGVVDVERNRDARAGFAIAVAPECRGEGVARAMVAALWEYPALTQVVEFFAGVEVGNDASDRLMRSAGFRVVTAPDHEGFVYFAARRDGKHPALPWFRPDR